MKRRLVNITCVAIIVVSAASWKFLFPKIFNSDTEAAQESVKVEGQKKEADPAPASDKNANANITFDKLYKDQPDAPLKKTNATEMYVRARSAIAIDAQTNTILHYQNGKKRMAIASLTKMMTAVLVMEHVEDLDKEVVTINKDMLRVEGTVIGCPTSTNCISNRIRVGEKLTVMSLMKAMLMNSCNDAAYALGIHIAGSKEKFADMMNAKAKDLGLMDTHFCNPNGLDEDANPGGCYSSAYDLARISAYSLKYDTVWNIMRQPDQDIVSTDGTISHHIINTDVLLEQMPNCLGGKTGFTYEAGKSLMMAAHHPLNRKHKVVAVLLDADYRWEDMRNLINWSFASYAWPQK